MLLGAQWEVLRNTTWCLCVACFPLGYIYDQTYVDVSNAPTLSLLYACGYRTFGGANPTLLQKSIRCFRNTTLKIRTVFKGDYYQSKRKGNYKFLAKIDIVKDRLIPHGSLAIKEVKSGGEAYHRLEFVQSRFSYNNWSRGLLAKREAKCGRIYRLV